MGLIMDDAKKLGEAFDKFGPHLKGRERSQAYWAYVKPVNGDE